LYANIEKYEAVFKSVPKQLISAVRAIAAERSAVLVRFQKRRRMWTDQLPIYAWIETLFSLLSFPQSYLMA